MDSRIIKPPIFNLICHSKSLGNLHKLDAFIKLIPEK